MSKPQKDADEIADTDLDAVVGGNAGRIPGYNQASNQEHQQHGHGGASSLQDREAILSRVNMGGMSDTHVHLSGTAGQGAQANAYTSGATVHLEQQRQLPHEASHQADDRGQEEQDK